MHLTVSKYTIYMPSHIILSIVIFQEIYTNNFFFYIYIIFNKFKKIYTSRALRCAFKVNLLEKYTETKCGERNIFLNIEPTGVKPAVPHVP